MTALVNLSIDGGGDEVGEAHVGDKASALLDLEHRLRHYTHIATKVLHRDVAVLNDLPLVPLPELTGEEVVVQ